MDESNSNRLARLPQPSDLRASCSLDDFAETRHNYVFLTIFVPLEPPDDY